MARPAFVRDARRSGCRGRVERAVEHQRTHGAGKALGTHLADTTPQTWKALLQFCQRFLPSTRGLRAALEYALAQAAMPSAGQADAAALLVDLHLHSAIFMSRAGLRLEAAHWHRAVQPYVDLAAAARSQGDGTEARRLAHRLAMAAAALSVFGLHIKPADVWPALGAAQAAFEADGRCEQAYMGLFLQSHLAIRLQRAGELDGLHERMRRLIRPAWNGRARSFAAWIGAIVHRARGEHRAYADFCIAERTRARQDDDPSGAWLAVYGLAQAQWALGERDAAIAMLDQTLAELHAADLLRENWHFAALAASLRLGRDASGETVRIARMAADLARADGLLWTLGDALALLAARQKRWDVAQGVRAWLDARLSTLGERRGEPAGSLCREFDKLRREAGERGGLRSALTLVSDADVLAAVF